MAIESQSLETILNTVETRLKTIKKANTNPRTGVAFRSDIGRLVIYGRPNDPSPDDNPAVHYGDISEDLALDFGSDARSVLLHIEAFQDSGDANIVKIARDLLHDIDSVLLWDSNGNKDHFLGGVCLRILFQKKDPFMLEDMPISGVMVDYQIVYDQGSKPE